METRKRSRERREIEALKYGVVRLWRDGPDGKVDPDGWIDIFATLDTIQSWWVCTYVSDYLKSKGLWHSQGTSGYGLEILRMKE